MFSPFNLHSLHYTGCHFNLFYIESMLSLFDLFYVQSMLSLFDRLYLHLICITPTPELHGPCSTLPALNRCTASGIHFYTANSFHWEHLEFIAIQLVFFFGEGYFVIQLLCMNIDKTMALKRGGLASVGIHSQTHGTHNDDHVFSSLCQIAVIQSINLC